MGTFKQIKNEYGRLDWVYEDKGVDEIYKTKEELEISVTKKVEELEKELDQLRGEFDKARDHLHEIDDRRDDEDDAEWENAWEELHEVSLKVDALERLIGQLNYLSEKLEGEE